MDGHPRPLPMTSLPEFLRARLDEDEAAAKTAAVDCPPPWQDDYGDLVDTSGLMIVDGADYGGAAWRGDTIPHITRHDPARVLREVEAGRHLIADYLEIGR